MSDDAINHPAHYNRHPSGVECITIIEHMGFNVGNAVKYLWRAGLKGNGAVEDLEKAAWYVNREIERVSARDERVCLRCGHSENWHHVRIHLPPVGALFGSGMNPATRPCLGLDLGPAFALLPKDAPRACMCDNLLRAMA